MSVSTDHHLALSIVVPTYNEVKNIGRLIDRIEKCMTVDHEIVVVDDNSQDGTAEAVRQMNNSNVRLIVRIDKKGLASAIFDGIAQSRGKYVAVIDADMQHPPEMIPVLLEEGVKGSDIVSASRYVPGSKIGFGASRKLVSKGYTLAVHALLPETRRVTDPASGFFLIRKAIMDGIKVHPMGFKAFLEIVVKTGLPVKEVPFSFDERKEGKSKVGAKVMWSHMVQLFSLNAWRLPKFMLVGGIGVVVNTAVLVVGLGYLPLLLASPMAIETSILANFAMNDLWTFAGRRGRGLAGRLLGYEIAVSLGAVMNYLIVLGLGALIYVLYANFIGIVIGSASNYLFSEHMVWKTKGGKSSLLPTRVE